MIEVSVYNETSELQVVVLGIPTGFGGLPDLEQCYDPKSRENIMNGTFPLEKDITLEMNEFFKILQNYGVQVFRPKNIKGLNQIFSRDISFVVGNKLVVPNIIEDRKKETQAITHIFQDVSSEIIKMPDDTRMEGGDVILFNEYIFLGYSEYDDFTKYNTARTNKNGIDFIKSHFLDKKVRSFELNKSDKNPRENSLHLDCCFQPIGRDMAIIYKGGFKNPKDIDFLVSLFSEEKIIFITKEEMYHMNANIFSISENIIVSEKGFTRLNNNLKDKGFIVEEINYAEISKMEGLLRCSTIPLKRK